MLWSLINVSLSPSLSPISIYRCDTDPTVIAHDNLHPTTKKTRGLMGEALDKRGLVKRYGPPAWSYDVNDGVCRMHDVGLMMHPNYADLHYVDTMVDLYSSPLASSVTKQIRSRQVKSKIKHQFQKLLVEVLENEGVAAAADDDATGGGAAVGGASNGSQASPSVGNKRKATQMTVAAAQGKRGKEEAKRLGGIFKKPATGEQPEAVESKVEMRAKELMEAYISKVDEGGAGVRFTTKQTIHAEYNIWYSFERWKRAFWLPPNARFCLSLLSHEHITMF